MSMLNKLPELPYGYGDLNRSISQEVMELHHKKHHQTYVDKLNQALDGVDVDFTNIEDLLRSIADLPEEVQGAVRNHGGGHYNHSNFWQWMSPDGGGEPSGEVAELINENYENFQSFVDEFSKAAIGLFGSGWVWLMPDGKITTTANQDNPIMKGESAPILGLDVWEHAYYLDYKNQRDKYIQSWWDVVNWSEVENRL